MDTNYESPSDCIIYKITHIGHWNKLFWLIVLLYCYFFGQSFISLLGIFKFTVGFLRFVLMWEKY